MAYEKKCPTCPRGCVLSEGQTGFCRARGMRNGEIVPLGYGLFTSLALDPIEKKPLARFCPGSRILSAGSFGCSFRCPFCQNHEISMAGKEQFFPEGEEERRIAPETLADMAEGLRPEGNIGVAFTYNEPLVCPEYVRDAARLLQKRGLKTVLVTNGCVTEETADMVLPFADALNIDLKSFREEVYREVLKGDLPSVLSFIEKANRLCHVELTTLVVPGMNDSEEEMRREARWIASLPGGREIPLHISRFFPRYRMADQSPTDPRVVLRLAETAGEYLRYVYTGNM